MSRRINYVIGILCCFLFFYTSSKAQSESAVFHIQVFKSDSSILREGTGFFMDGQNGYTYALLFRGGSFAHAITSDSEIHKVNNIVGFDSFNGIVKIGLDNMLTSNASKLKSSSNMSAKGTSIKILYSDGAQSSKTISMSVVNKIDYVGYGQTIRLDGKFESKFMGCPVVNGRGEAEGMVVPINAYDRHGYSFR